MRLLIFVLVAATLAGCTHYAPPGENHPVRVVTQIEVIALKEGNSYLYKYQKPEKMQIILHYLRQLDPANHPPIAPDTFRSDFYDITLTLSDGSQSVYHLVSNAYLQRDNGSWCSINESVAGMLPQILQSVPSDQV